jgi:hypothetical protein
MTPRVDFAAEVSLRGRRIGLLTPAMVGLSLACFMTGCAGTTLPPGLGRRLDQMKHEESVMVSAAKAKGLIPTAFPANCARMEASTSWGTLDEPGWNQRGARCSAVSRKLLIVLHKIHARWRVAGSTSAFPSRDGCGHIAGVPPAIQHDLILCYPPHQRLPATFRPLP